MGDSGKTKIPFYERPDGALESEWFLMKRANGKLYKAKIILSEMPEPQKEENEAGI